MAETLRALKGTQRPRCRCGVRGPHDLSISLGLPAQFDHPDFQAALGTLVKACRAAHMPLGIFRMRAPEVFAHEGQGFTPLAVGLDGHLLEAVARSLLTELKQGAYSGQ